MNTVRMLVFCLVGALFLMSCEVHMYEPKTGDIVFHISRSEQSVAIQRATGSRYSHCGLVVVSGGSTWVIEAVGPVRIVKLEEWALAGKERRYVARRPVEGVLDSAAAVAVFHAARDFMGTPYDSRFEWDDNTIYCSELVWKAFKRGANVELCATKRLDDMNLKDSEVQRDMVRRYGNNIPFSEQVVSPGMLFNSELLETVFEN